MTRRSNDLDGATGNVRRPFAASTPATAALNTRRKSLETAAYRFEMSGACHSCSGGLHQLDVALITLFFNLDRENPAWRVLQDANRRSSDPT